MAYKPTICIEHPDQLRDMDCGQWISLNGLQGRFCGVKNGCHWVAWSETARKRFKAFCDAYKAN